MNRFCLPLKWSLLHFAIFFLAPQNFLLGTDLARQPTLEEVKFFESKVRPLLAARCYKCHGEDEQKAGLRLDSRGAMVAGGESGEAVVPGHPEKSLLVEAINYESFEMPPNGKLPQEEIETLVAWVKMGAPWPGSDETIRNAKPQSKEFTAEDRSWWSFQSIANPPVPQLSDDRWAKNDIDRFILAKLHAQGLAPSHEASRQQLIRRVYFDLIGLPPSPEEVNAFVKDESPDAYEQLIDRLLDSPQYGEKWARHWLDIVRFAESDGYKQDDFRPEAWRYRDYVIRSLNADKPYDRFVMEQLAGDEIAPGDTEALTATQFLRHGQYEYNQRDVIGQWNLMLQETTDVTADVFLGLGMGCAKCHDHKFDPILQKDYYRLLAFFTPLLPREDLPVASLDELALRKTEQEKYDASTQKLRRELFEMEWPLYLRTAGGQGFDKFTDDLKAMMLKSPAERTALEHQLAELALRQCILDEKKMESKLSPAQKTRREELKQQLATFDKQKPSALPTWKFCVSDAGRISPPTFIAGKERLGEIEPGFLSILSPEPAMISLAPESLASTGRRSALAKWIASAENPFTSRVIVNRVWGWHFGKGLLETTSDFGRLGGQPTHPELLDWLASRFVAQGWKLKPLHREILLSATYRQSAQTENAEGVRQDPQNYLLWRQNIRRLDAEQIRDAALAVTGELDGKAGGPSVGHAAPRRTIFTKVVRNTRDPLLAAFDAPDALTSASDRPRTTTSTQALLMINGDWHLKRASALAQRLSSEKLSSESQLVERAWELCYGRSPAAEEMEAAIEFLGNKRTAKEPVAPVNTKPKPALGKPEPVPSLAKDLGSAAAFKPGSKLEKLEVPFDVSLPAGDFTIEAFVQLDSIYDDASVRTIASHWDSDPASPGWSFGVTSKQSRYKPRNLILQLIGMNLGNEPLYEVVASNIHLELHRPYYVAARVKIDDTSKSGITFYVKELFGEQKLYTSSAEHSVVTDYRPSRPLSMGGRAAMNHHTWDGLIDNVRLSSTVLPESQLFINAGPNTRGEATVGLWRFETEPGYFADASPNKNNLILPGASPSSSTAMNSALVDLCHVLLNSNEFLYVD